MKTAATLTLLILIAAHRSAFADPAYDKCINDSDGTNTAWGQCGGDWIKRADEALNKAWSSLHSFVTDKDTADALRDEQRAWNAYKEKSCMFYAGGYYGREGQVLSFPSCRADVIEARTEELKAYLKDLQQP